MTVPFAIDHRDIDRLSDQRLTELLRRLLVLEAERLGVAKQAVSVSLKINIPDGGQDGRFEWSEGPEPNGWVESRLTVYQVKATQMGPADCGKEILSKDAENKPVLKPRVNDVVQAGGAYVLFYGRNCEGDMVDDRVNKIRETMANHSTRELANAVTIRVFGAEKIAEWTNEHAAATTYVLESVGKVIPATLQPWTGWDAEHRCNLALHLDTQRQEVLNKLRDLCRKPRTVGRILGLSGLGKSRLAMEAFRPPLTTTTTSDQVDPDAAQRALSAACVYISQGAQVDSGVVAVLRSLRARGASGTIVVDECPLDLHIQLERIVTAPDSRLSLLTLDFDPTGDPKSSGCELFHLDRFEDSDVEALLRGTHFQLPEEQVSRIANLAQGFPRMADLLVGVLRESEPRLWELAPKDVYRRLVVRRSPNEEEVWKVAKGLAVFEHLGTDGDVAYQLPSFAEHICALPKETVYARLHELEIAGIAYRRGDWLRLTPLPLAIALAAEWWDERWEPAAINLLAADKLPQAMVDAMASQLRRLKGHPFAERLMKRLYGRNGPFRTRDFLDSAHGSRVTNFLAEVSPKAVSGALFSVFSSFEPDEAREVRAGRRYLVWALEKLAWWPESFHDAARLLLLFGAGENEGIGNNATAQFLQLFHIHLSGTEVPAQNRLQVVQIGLTSEHPTVKATCVAALLSALTSGHFSRSGVVDAQGPGFQRSDWSPCTYGEIWDYWDEALTLLEPFLLADDDLGERARTEVANNTRGIIRMGGLHLVERSIDTVVGAGVEWPQMLDGLRFSMNYDGSEYPEEIRGRVAGLIKRLEPTGLAARLQHVVAHPSWNELRRDENGLVTQVAEERARALANEIATDPSVLEQHWSIILSGDQRQGFAFGWELAARAQNPKELLVKASEMLRAVVPETRNDAVLMGMARAIADSEPDWLRGFVREVFADDELRPFAVDMMRAQIPNDQDILLVVVAVAAGTLDVRVASLFSVGGALEPVSDHVVGQLVEACAGRDSDGRRVALEILGMKLHSRELGDDLLPCAVMLTNNPQVLEAAAKAGTMADYHFERLVDVVLSHPGRPATYLPTLASVVFEQLCGDDFLSSLLRSLLKKLLLQDPEAAWPIIQEKMQSNDGVRVHRLLLGLEDAFKNADVVAAVGEERLLGWVRNYPSALYLVGRMTHPLRGRVADANYPSWTPLAQQLLLKFGSDDGLRSGLAASIYSGIWWGSVVPRLQAHREAFEELVRHPVKEVRDWARSSIAELDVELERERKRDDEQDFGLFR